MASSHFLNRPSPYKSPTTISSRSPSCPPLPARPSRTEERLFDFDLRRTEDELGLTFELACHEVHLVRTIEVRHSPRTFARSMGCGVIKVRAPQEITTRTACLFVHLFGH